MELLCSRAVNTNCSIGVDLILHRSMRKCFAAVIQCKLWKLVNQAVNTGPIAVALPFITASSPVYVYHP